jgi:hypothetical protein
MGASAIEAPAPRAVRETPAPRETAVRDIFERPRADRAIFARPEPRLAPRPAPAPERSRARLDDDLFEGGPTLRAVNGGR